jgi:hypothetical protein
VSTKYNATVSDLVGYVSSWSAFQNYQNQEGEEKAADILRRLEQELVQLYTLYLIPKIFIGVLRIFTFFFPFLSFFRIMDMIRTAMPPSETHLEIEYNYFLLMGRKPLL